jgi:hypothetical protein
VLEGGESGVLRVVYWREGRGLGDQEDISLRTGQMIPGSFPQLRENWLMF